MIMLIFTHHSPALTLFHSMRSLQGSHWPSGRLKNRVSKATPSTVAQSWPRCSQVAVKKRELTSLDFLKRKFLVIYGGRMLKRDFSDCIIGHFCQTKFLRMNLRHSVKILSLILDFFFLFDVELLLFYLWTQDNGSKCYCEKWVKWRKKSFHFFNNIYKMNDILSVLFEIPN